ncbi:MAG: DUF262 domain-containing protein [Paludibacteraceae bacterium]|nr:DUF262 domain-containing protein [Paludibacteraceae bacterium]
MDYLKIYDNVINNFRDRFANLYPQYKVKSRVKGWHQNRWIQVETAIKGDFDIHYEYGNGYVKLHLEGKYSELNNNISKELKDCLPVDQDFKWHNWFSRQKGSYQYECYITSEEELLKNMCVLIKRVEPILQSIQSSSKPSSPKIQQLTYDIKSISDINFGELTIPEYQRPYKWTKKNVDQLIDDILTFKNKSSYRLGSLVLYNSDIVDGQQRTVTLALLLHELKEKFSDIVGNEFQEFFMNMESFWEKTSFKNPISIANIRKNLEAIQERISDLDESFFRFLLQNCQFVLIILPEIEEAFQFFDSQNSRGKDLEVHDLLKAFHLREIDNFTIHDSDNINQWQTIDTQHLASLFLVMFRIKRWAKSSTARYLTKKHTSEFKGISLSNTERYPVDMMQIMCHHFSNYYSQHVDRFIDHSTLEFPFQLDQPCINGSRFFDMVNHYDTLYNKIQDIKSYGKFPRAKNIIETLNTYKESYRDGDKYARALFDATLMYYVDKFGFTELDRAIYKIFKFAYKIRIFHYSLQLASVDNYVVRDERFFQEIRNALKPSDFFSIKVDSIKQEDCASNSSKELKEIYFNRELQ